MLPVASAMAIIMVIFAAVAAGGWFARAKDGLESPALPEELLGLLTIIVIPVQILLIAVAMVGFNQAWNVEEERPIGGRPPRIRRRPTTPEAAESNRGTAAVDRAERRDGAGTISRRPTSKPTTTATGPTAPRPAPRSEPQNSLHRRLEQVRPVLADVVDAVADLAQLQPVLGRRPEQLEQRLRDRRRDPARCDSTAGSRTTGIRSCTGRTVSFGGAGDQRAAGHDVVLVALAGGPRSRRRRRGRARAG